MAKSKAPSKSKSKSVSKAASKSASKKAAPKAAKTVAKAAAKVAVKKSAPKKAAPKAKPAAKTKVAAKPAAKKAAVVKAAPKAAAKVVAPKAAPKVANSLSAKRFTPLDDRILVERLVAETKTAGGLYIPDSAQEKPTSGRVVAVGRGHRDAKGRTRPCDVEVGDTVLFSAWAGSEIEIKIDGEEGQKFTILRETDLLGVSTN